MTTAKLIGRETAIARIIDFHHKRAERVFSNDPWRQFEIENWWSVEAYKNKTSRSIYKEYDETFGNTPLTETEKREILNTIENHGSK